MIKMTREEILKKLEERKDGKSISFVDVDFRGVDLSNLNFSQVKFFNVLFDDNYLHNINFIESYFQNAVFYNCALFTVLFTYATFLCCNFAKSNMIKTDFGGAFIENSSFCGACLTKVDFSNSTFVNSDFRESKIFSTSFSDCRCKHMYSENMPYFSFSCPSEGEFIGWKKVRTGTGCSGIVKLLIPADAKRVSSSVSNKCRCDKAIVLEIKTLSGEDMKIAYSFHNSAFKYIVGNTVTPEFEFDDDVFKECASGIHFFIDKRDAERY